MKHHAVPSAMHLKVSPPNPLTCMENPKEARFNQMDRQIAAILYVLVMIAIIVGVDVGFFRNRFWERLIVNIGIVLLFGAFYFRFFRHS
jgi:type IV secretory pathway VirB2 component (pilin)